MPTLLPPAWWNVGWCCRPVWTLWPLPSHMVLVPAIKVRGRFVPRVEQLGMMGVRSVVGEVLPCAARAWFTEVLWGVWAAPGAAAAAVADPPTTQRLLLMCRLS